MSLKEYVRVLYELESSIFQQRNLIQKLEQQMASLPQEPKEPNEKGDGSGSIAIVMILLEIVSWCVIFFTQIGWGWKVLIGLFAVSGISGVIAGVSGYNADDARRYQARIDYQNQMQAYTASLPFANEMQKDLPVLKSKIKDSELLLRSAYEQNIIFPKYRNFVAVSSIYEYLSSGRCDTLEGPNGAYNIFEQESRLDRIIIRLDDVIANLGRIQNNQFMLYSAIQQSNRNTESLYQAVQDARISMENNAANITNNLDKIQLNSKLTAYTSELTHKEVAYRNMLELGSPYLRT
ncbi:MAG: hypothetical protein ACI3VK_01835 [Oscillospiraceae bacterium]